MNKEGLRLYKEWVMGFYRSFNCLPDCIVEMNEYAEPDWTPAIEMLDAGCTKREIAEIDRYYKTTMCGEIEDEIMEDEMDSAGFDYEMGQMNSMLRDI